MVAALLVVQWLGLCCFNSSSGGLYRQPSGLDAAASSILTDWSAAVAFTALILYPILCHMYYVQVMLSTMLSSLVQLPYFFFAPVQHFCPDLLNQDVLLHVCRRIAAVAFNTVPSRVVCMPWLIAAAAARPSPAPCLLVLQMLAPWLQYYQKWSVCCLESVPGTFCVGISTCAGSSPGMP